MSAKIHTLSAELENLKNSLTGRITTEFDNWHNDTSITEESLSSKVEGLEERLAVVEEKTMKCEEGSMRSDERLDEALDDIKKRGMPKFKKSMPGMTRVMCPMANKVDCKFRCLVDKDGRELFNEHFDQNTIKSFKVMDCGGGDECCHDSFSLPSALGFAEGYETSMNEWSEKLSGTTIENRSEGFLAQKRSEIKRHLTKDHGKSNDWFLEHIPCFATRTTISRKRKANK